VDVHFVTIEISVVGSANAFVEAESPARHNFGSVCHYRHSMKAWLSVEQYCVAIRDMTFNNVPDCKLIGDFPSVGVHKINLNWAITTVALLYLNKVCSRVNFGAIPDQCS